MTHDAFFRAVKEGQIAGAYLFSGEEEHVKASALAALRKRLLPEGLEVLNETILQSPASGDIIAAAETLPVMAERRLVLVKESTLLVPGRAAGEAEESAALIAYLDRLPETACLVFYCRGKADGRKKLTAALVKKGLEVRFDALDDASLSKWVMQQCRARQKTISPSDAGLLFFTAGRSLLVLGQEIAKACAYAGDRSEVTRQDIEAVVTPSLECTVFQMVDALADKNAKEALRLLDRMLEVGEARIGILAMMVRQYRLLLHLKLMQAEGVPDAEAQKRLGVQAFSLRRLKAQARGNDEQTLKAQLSLCVDTDYGIKRGKMREDVALERAILVLCG